MPHLTFDKPIIAGVVCAIVFLLLLFATTNPKVFF